MLPPNPCPPYFNNCVIHAWQTKSYQACLALALSWALPLWALRFHLDAPGVNDSKNQRGQACRASKASKASGLDSFRPKSASNSHFSLMRTVSYTGLRATPFSERPPSAHPCVQFKLGWTPAGGSHDILKTSEEGVGKGFALTSKCRACAASRAWT